MNTNNTYVIKIETTPSKRKIWAIVHDTDRVVHYVENSGKMVDGEWVNSYRDSHTTEEHIEIIKERLSAEYVFLGIVSVVSKE